MKKESHSTKHPSLPCEDEIVSLARRDRESFTLLYDHYSPKIYQYILYRVHHREDVEDLTCTVFELSFTKLHTYHREKGPFGAWLFAIARNTVYDYYRRKKNREKHTTEMPSYYEIPESSNLEGVILKRESHQELYQALQRLSPREQDLIGLKFASRMTNRRIAALTGLTESNVGVILYRAIRRLRDLLCEDT